MHTFASESEYIYSYESKNSRLEALKMLISSMELSSQEEVLKELEKEGFKRLRQHWVVISSSWKWQRPLLWTESMYMFCQNETMYRRVTTPRKATEMMQRSGYISVNISGQLAIVKTRPGLCQCHFAYDIDNSDSPYIF